MVVVVEVLAPFSFGFKCRSFLPLLRSTTTNHKPPPPTSHLSVCPADTSPSAGKSSREGPAPVRIAPGTSRPPRSSGRAAGQSSSTPPEQPSFQAERNRRGGLAARMRLCANEMNGGSEGSTGVKMEIRVARSFRGAHST